MSRSDASGDPAAGSFAAARVLLVDDQPIIGEEVRRIVRGHEDIVLETVTDPLEAMAHADRFGPTVILLDLVMPVMDGLTLLQFLRAHAPTRNVRHAAHLWSRWDVRVAGRERDGDVRGWWADDVQSGQRRGELQHRELRTVRGANARAAQRTDAGATASGSADRPEA